MPSSYPTSSRHVPPEGDPTIRCWVADRAGGTPPILNATTANSQPTDAAPGSPDAPAGYTLLDRLGGGGMGEVYLAREQATERMVAMKFLRSPADPGLHDRFLVEVRALARLDHPNIIAIHTADLARREPYFTMEYAAGGSLAKLVERSGPLDPADAARLMAAVARAVHSAHDAGILHRDLKPSNILLAGVEGHQVESRNVEDTGAAAPDFTILRPSDFTTPKVSDFGLAKRTDRDDDLTVTLLALGTPGYMAPEQVSRRYGDVGPAVDVHGLGATLYHLLTGKAPFPTGSPEEVVRRLTNDDPARLRAVRPEVPAGLEAVVMKCLAKDPADRYASAAAVADDLDRFLSGADPSAPRLTLARRAAHSVGRRWRLAAGLLAAVGLFAIGAATSLWPTRPGPVPPATAEVLRNELACGREVTLVGPTGGPAYHRAVLGPVTLGQSSVGDGTCSFQAQGFEMLELLPDPGVDRYSVRLDIRQIAVAPDPIADVDYVGLYFGRREVLAPNGAVVHAMFAVRFRDYPVTAPRIWQHPTHQVARFDAYGLFQHPQNGLVPQTVWWGKTPFTSVTAGKPGLWRTITADVTPDALVVRWADDGGEPRDLIRWTGDKARARAWAMNTQLVQSDPGGPSELPGWIPRLPLGVFANRTVVCIRNVVVTPLP